MWEIARILRNARKEMGRRACGGQMITHASFTTWETAANNGQFISPYVYVCLFAKYIDTENILTRAYFMPYE